MARVNARIGEAKAVLKDGIATMKEAVRKNKAHLSEGELLMHLTAIAQMESATKQLKAIDCIQPAMSFDMPFKYPKPKPSPVPPRSRKKK